MIESYSHRERGLFKQYMRISLVISCHIEPQNAQSVVASYVSQSRPLDEIILVSSPHSTHVESLLKSFPKISIVQAPKRLHSTDQLHMVGLKSVTGEVCIVTDAHSPLSLDFVKQIEARFQSEKKHEQIRFLQNKEMNYLTLCDHTDRTIQEKIFHYFHTIFPYFYLTPSRTFAFRAQDLSGVIKLKQKKISKDLNILAELFQNNSTPVYTLDTFKSSHSTENLEVYVQELQEIYAREWRLFKDYFSVPRSIKNVLSFSLLYIKNLIFFGILFLLPLINITLSFTLLAVYVLLIGLFSLFLAIEERRFDALFVLPGYIFLRYIRAYIFAEQFFKTYVIPQKTSLSNVHFTVVPLLGMAFSLGCGIASVLYINTLVYKVVFTLLSLVFFSNFAAQGAVYWLNKSYDRHA